MIFPEIDFDKVEKIHGMDITLVTSTTRDDLAMALLREFGWPFRGETPQRVAEEIGTQWQRPVGSYEPSARRSSSRASYGAVSGAAARARSCASSASAVSVSVILRSPG
jgi:hypothetical protein